MKRLVPALVFSGLLLSGCEQEPVLTDEESALYSAAFDGAEMTMDVQEKWARTCALCHVSGEGGAPRMGDADAWGPRAAQGRTVMLKHVLDGLNRMPPLGYCMDCELSDFAAMIDMMAGSR